MIIDILYYEWLSLPHIVMKEAWKIIVLLLSGEKRKITENECLGVIGLCLGMKQVERQLFKVDVSWLRWADGLWSKDRSLLKGIRCQLGELIEWWRRGVWAGVRPVSVGKKSVTKRWICIYIAWLERNERRGEERRREEKRKEGLHHKQVRRKQTRECYKQRE